MGDSCRACTKGSACELACIDMVKAGGVLPHGERFCSRIQRGHLQAYLLCCGPGPEGEEDGTVPSQEGVATVREHVAMGTREKRAGLEDEFVVRRKKEESLAN